MRISPFAITITIILAASCLILGCREGSPVSSAESTKAPSDPGHRRMIEILDAIEEQAGREVLFLRTTDLDDVELRWSSLPESATALERAFLKLELGEHLLRLGRTEEAIAAMEQARSLTQGIDRSRDEGLADALLYRLGVAALRLGETTNCIAAHVPQSCIFPIAAAGQHRDQSGSRLAMQYFRELLKREGVDPTWSFAAKWLLNIAAMTVGEWPDGVAMEQRVSAESLESREGFPQFEGVAAAVGLATESLSGGVVVDDLDGDGRLDLMVSSYDPAVSLRFFHNAGEKGFVDRSQDANIQGLRGGLNLVHADYDNDGDNDILVLRGAWMGAQGRHPNSLLRNDGEGRFTDVTFAAGLADESFPTQTAAFADYDLDGDLDLYLGNEATPENRFRSQLFKNDGKGHFIETTEQAGVGNFGYAKGVTWGDYDDDGDPDLYVSNLWGPNRLYRNEGDGSFRELAGQLGVDGPLMSFATWFFDYDNDGDLDLYVAAYVEQVPASVASYFGKEVRGARNHLYRNEGNGTFAEVAAELGLTRLVTTMGAGFGDLDQDGWLDFYLGTGYPAYEALLPNVMYRNDRGRHFVDVTYSGGFGHLQKGHAIAFADLDDDGDQDVFEQMGGAYRGDLAYDKLYENPGFAGRHTVTLKLEGRTSNRCAIGARVTIRVDEGGRTRAIHRMVGPRGSFGSGPLRLEVGLGDATSIREIEVRWPGGGRPQVVRDLHVDRLYHIREGEDLPGEASRRTFVMPR